MKSNYVLEPKRKRVALIDDKGLIQKVFSSQSDAGFRTDTSSSAVAKVCKGIITHAKGFKFKNITEELYLELKK